MFACRSKRRIGHRRNRDFQKWLSRKASILSVIRRAFEVIHCGPDMNDAARSGGRRLTLCRFKLGKGIQRKVDLGDCPSRTNVFDLQEKLRIQEGRLNQTKKSPLNVGT